jgi:hypothetical protein
MILAILLLITGLTISAVAIYYSVVGLTAIFSAAVIPIIVMGSALELGKLVCASWLKANWDNIPKFMKYYMVVAITVLMLITSMGIFGFLSKAHNDQNLVSGDVQSKLVIYDEKIKTARENIEADRKQLKQMDEAVDQIMARSTSENGADKANAVRKSQQRDRGALAKDIETQQKIIVTLNDEAAPIRAENRKVEAEVGPIKYIAAFIYGANPNDDILEKAVTWIIVLIVTVFDPLAVIMLLASQMTFAWVKEQKEKYSSVYDTDVGQPPTEEEKAAYNADDGLPSEEYIEAFRKSVPIPPGNTVTTSSLFPESDSTLDPCYKCGTPLIIAPGIGPFCPNKNCDVFDNTLNSEVELITTTVSDDIIPNPAISTDDIEPYGNDIQKHAMRVWKIYNPNETYKKYIEQLNAGEIEHLPWEHDSHYESLNLSDRELLELQTKLVADNESVPGEVKGFGIEFPDFGNKGDMFLRVDNLPSQLYKFNGTQWIKVNKNLSDGYVYDDAYIDHLIEKIGSGEYDPDLLSDAERERIADRLKNNSKDII